MITCFRFIGLPLASGLLPGLCELQQMTLKIERSRRGDLTVLKLIGQIGSCDLAELKLQMEEAGPEMQFDLDDVTLVDVGVIRFLTECGDSGVEFLNCPLYIREWIKRQKEKK